MTKIELAEKIRRRFGHPMVKVELDNSQIFDSIDFARQKWIKWAVGQSTHEVFFTIALSGGQNFYDLPIGVTEIVAYLSDFSTGGINTLFTIDNYMYNQGLYDGMRTTSGNPYSMIDYHIALDFLETLRKYTPDSYNWKYHRYSNQLEIHPAPSSGSSLEVLNASGGTIVIDSPGFILLKGYMIEGSTYSDWETGDSNTDFYGEDWILDYAFAQSMVIIGRIRNKFANFASIGNVGISLDGDSLISEGNEKVLALEEKLHLEEAFDGYGILFG